MTRFAMQLCLALIVAGALTGCAVQTESEPTVEGAQAPGDVEQPSTGTTEKGAKEKPEAAPVKPTKLRDVPDFRSVQDNTTPQPWMAVQ